MLNKKSMLHVFCDGLFTLKENVSLFVILRYIFKTNMIFSCNYDFNYIKHVSTISLCVKSSSSSDAPFRENSQEKQKLN